MLGAYEWSSYSQTRKPLRVSSKPRVEQRTTYFLQLPYRYAFPLLGISGTLHYLISQSIFLASIQLYGTPGGGDRGWSISEKYEDSDIMTCGYSPLMIFFSVCVSVFMVALGLGIGYGRKLRGRMPLVGSYSAAISAACHSGREEGYEVGTALKPLIWGFVGQVEGVNKYGFESRDVDVGDVCEGVYGDEDGKDDLDSGDEQSVFGGV